ncbi:MAG: metallophosphoesterase [Clostridia bacterium]|nr:metallophosphoesterase [Clostridia bacterium]
MEYKNENDVIFREVIINTDKGGDDVTIVQLTDSHYWAFTDADLENPVLASTKQNRVWRSVANGASVANTEKVLAYADSVADQIMVTGDVMDFLSEGTLNLLKTTIWDKYGVASGKDKVMVSVGNHEPVRQMQGEIADTDSRESRLRVLQDNWEHDIYYTSRVLKDKVMVIQLDNGSADKFLDIQVDHLKSDLALAREKGYTVLLFYHIPLSTGNPDNISTAASKVGDKNNTFANFYSKGINRCSDGASGEIYGIITNNADIIKGCFCGHKHCDFYTEINAKTADGKDTVIPQYILIGTPYGAYATKIIVK